MSYLSTALDRVIPENRPIYYSIFAALLHWGLTPWPVAIVQAAIAATVIWHVARVMFGIRNWRALIALAAALTIASALPWYVGHMSPDTFTPVLILSLTMLGLCWERLGVVARGLYLVAVAACVSFHYGNLAIALGANLVFAVIALLGWRPEGKARPRVLAMNGAVLAGMAALFAATTYDHGRPALSPSSNSFYLARLLDDGSALKLLNRDCAVRTWRVCAERQALNAYAAGRAAEPANPAYAQSLADHFLWGGGLERLGGFEGMEREAGEIVRGAWAAYPIDQVGATFANGFGQAFSFQFGEFLKPWPGEPGPTIARIFGDGAAQAFANSMQQRGAWNFGLLNIPANFLLIASFTFLIYASVINWKRERFWAYAALALVFFLLGNAFVTGALSGVFDNYQARVIWLAPLMALMLAARLYWPLAMREGPGALRDKADAGDQRPNHQEGEHGRPTQRVDQQP